MESTAQKTVLLVDDEEAFLLSLAEGLCTLEEGLDVVLATDGTMALDLLHRCDIDLLVTDLKMPGIDGFALLKRAKARFPELPTMVVTSVGTPEIEDRISRLGVRDQFEKPLNLEEFVASIRRVLSNHGPLDSNQEGKADDQNQ